MLKSTFRAVLSKLSIPLWLAILLSATVPVLAAQQHRANLEAAAIGPQPQVVEQDHVLSFEQPSYIVPESAGSLDVIVELTEPYTDTTTVTVNYSTTDDTATASEDYTSASGTLEFPPNVITDTFTVNILQDDVDEGDETFTLNLTGASGATIGTPTAPVTITDDDEADIQVSPTSLTVTEGDPPGSFAISLSSQPLEDVTVNLAAGDECTVNPTSVAFTSVDWQEAQSVEVSGVEDGIVDGTQQCLVTTTKSTGDSTYSTVTVEDVDVTVLDGDLPTVQFSSGAYNVGEGGGSVEIEVELSDPVGSEVTVTAATTDSGTATASSDYTAFNQVVTIPATETSATFNVSINDDSLHENDETFGLSLSNVSANATIGTPSSATVTITDNDPQPNVRFSSDSYPVNEGDGARQVAVQLSAAAGVTVTVDYTTSDGSATSGSDYTMTAGTLTFAPGDTIETFNVPIINDNMDEPTETVDLALSSPNNANLGSITSATIFIQDNDPTPEVEFHGTPYSVNEGDGSATITVVLSNPAKFPVSVDYATSDGTATAGADYTSRDNTLVFNSGVITRTFTVLINDDLVEEDAETVNLALSNPQGATLGTPSNSVLTIIDNEGPTEIHFASTTYSVTESAVTATIDVVRSGLSILGASVDYATTSGGSATEGVDYTATSGTLNFGPNETLKSFSVPILSDAINEPPETVNLELSNPVGALPGDPSTAVLTIHDSNETPAVQFSQDTYTVDESMLTADITVTLSIAKAQDVTVFYGVQEGTATLGEDFATTGGELTIPAGATAATFSVSLLPDQIDEPDETVILSINGADGADLGARTSASLVILDNDPTPTLSFSLSSLIVGETDGTADIPVRLSAESGRTVTVNYATVDGTAIAGSDYIATHGTLTFAPGDTSKMINVPLLEGLGGEPNETFEVWLSGPTNATLTTPDTATVTIVDGELVRYTRFFPNVTYFSIGEPNDECSEAYEIMPFQTYLFAPDDGLDWYQFTVSEPGNLILEVNNFVPSRGQLGLVKGETCADLELLGHIGVPESNMTIDAGFQEPGHYFIFVANDEEPSFEPYQLRVRLEAE